MTRHLVVGAGEVGTAVAAVLSPARDVVVRDVDPVDVQADVLEVCIPWSEKFVPAVRGYVAEHGVGLVVVHSTVPVGTCDAEGWVHSPVRGRHPDLVPGLRAFVKHFGGERAADAAKAWADAGVVATEHSRAAETEAGKLWELVQYGISIQVQRSVYAWCAEQALDPGVVYRQFAEEYNSGYRELGEGWAVRPVIRDMPGPIGGHCVRPMSRLLDHPLADVVREGFG